MLKNISKEALLRLRDNPFLRIKEENIQLRAYYHWLNRSGVRWDDSKSNWLQAEQEELLLRVHEQLVFPVNTELSQDVQKICFDDEYRLIASYVFPIIPRPNQRNDTLGSKSSPRYCSLCQRKSPEVTFREEKHIIPEQLGNRWLLTYNECDACNQGTGKDLENELGKMLNAERAIARTPAKTRTARL